MFKTVDNPKKEATIIKKWITQEFGKSIHKDLIKDIMTEIINRKLRKALIGRLESFDAGSIKLIRDKL